MNTNGLGFVNWKHARDVLVYNYKSSQTIWKKWLDSCRASLTLWKIYNARSNRSSWQTWLQHRNKNHAAYIYVHWIPAADNERADADSLVTALSTTRWWVIFLGVGTAWRIQFPRWSSPWFSCLLLGSMRGPIKRHTHFRVYFRMAKTNSHHTGHDSFFFQMIFVILFPFLFSPIKDKTPMWWGLDY